MPSISFSFMKLILKYSVTLNIRTGERLKNVKENNSYVCSSLFLTTFFPYWFLMERFILVGDVICVHNKIMKTLSLSAISWCYVKMTKNFSKTDLDLPTKKPHMVKPTSAFLVSPPMDQKEVKVQVRVFLREASLLGPRALCVSSQALPCPAANF